MLVEPEFQLVNALKATSGELTDPVLLNLFEHQVARIEMCLNTLAVRQLVRPIRKGDTVADHAVPMATILHQLQTQMAEFMAFKQQHQHHQHHHGAPPMHPSVANCGGMGPSHNPGPGPVPSHGHQSGQESADAPKSGAALLECGSSTTGTDSSPPSPTDAAWPTPPGQTMPVHQSRLPMTPSRASSEVGQ